MLSLKTTGKSNSKSLPRSRVYSKTRQSGRMLSFICVKMTILQEHSEGLVKTIRVDCQESHIRGEGIEKEVC